MPQQDDQTIEIVGWARVYQAVRRMASKTMRRGAWYPVVCDELSDRVTIKVGPQAVEMPRRILEVRRQRPEHFSVITRAGYHRDPRRKSEHGLGRHYAVCPACAHRFGLFGAPETMFCPLCNHQAKVGWWED